MRYLCSPATTLSLAIAVHLISRRATPSRSNLMVSGCGCTFPDLEGQFDTLGHVIKRGRTLSWWALDWEQRLKDAQKVIAFHRDALPNADGLGSLRMAEARGAAAYWSAVEGLPLRWPKAMAKTVPEHWLTIQTRASGRTGDPQHARDPVNAILNLCYSLLEVSTKTACAIAGLDPDFGMLHALEEKRHSFVYDLMEVARPRIDRYVLDFALTHTMGAKEFHETREGVCRLDPDLTAALAEGFPDLGEALGGTITRISRILTFQRVDSVAKPTKRLERFLGNHRARALQVLAEAGMDVAGVGGDAPTLDLDGILKGLASNEFDPAQDDPIVLRTTPGTYALCLKDDIDLLEGLEETVFKTLGGHRVLYVGTCNHLRDAAYRSHFRPRTGGGRSSVVQGVGLLLGCRYLPREDVSQKPEFKPDDLIRIADWMEKSLLIHYVWHNNVKAYEDELVQR